MTLAVDHMGTRLAAVLVLLTAQLSTRHVTRNLKHFTDQPAADIADGILTIVSAGEGNYKNQRGMVAKEGTGRLLLIGHLKLAESASGQAVEDAEVAFIEEVKAALRVGVTGIGFALQNVEHSRQLDRPYGWFVASVDAGPPLESIR